MNVGNILQNIVSPIEHCYGSESCYDLSLSISILIVEWQTLQLKWGRDKHLIYLDDQALPNIHKYLRWKVNIVLQLRNVMKYNILNF